MQNGIVNIADLANGICNVPASVDKAAMVQAIINAPATVAEQKACATGNTYAIDPSNLNNGSQNFYYGNFVNNEDETLDIIIGGGLGIAGAYQEMITTPSGVDFAGFLEDSRGALYDNNAMSLQGLNQRIRSAQIIIDSIEISTTSATQANQALTLGSVNNDFDYCDKSTRKSFCDECSLNNNPGVFNKRFSGPFSANINNFISYPVLAGATVEFQVNIASQALGGLFVDNYGCK